MVAKVRHHPDHPLYDKILKEDEFYLSLRHFVNEIKTPSIECKNSWFEWSYVKLSKINNSRHHSFDMKVQKLGVLTTTNLPICIFIFCFFSTTNP